MWNESNEAEGIPVALGRHTVAPGVAVEEFLDHDENSQVLPSSSLSQKQEDGDSVPNNLLQEKDAVALHEELRTKFLQRGRASAKETWNEARLVSVVQELRPRFAEKGLALALCILRRQRSSGSSTRSFRWLWLEFVAVDRESRLSAFYDVSHYQVVLSNKNYIIPPVGVAVETLDDWKPKRIQDECPPAVQALLEPLGLMPAYQNLATALWENKKTRNWAQMWKTSAVLEVVQDHQQDFRRQQVEVVVAKYPADSASWAKWLEFVHVPAVTETTAAYTPLHNVDEVNRADLARRLLPQTPAMMRSGASDTASTSTVVVREDLVIDGRVRLAAECPVAVQELLQSKDLVADYGKLDVALSRSKGLRNFLDLWRMTASQVVSFAPIEELRHSFQAQGIELVLCESVGETGKPDVWLEFVDTQAMPDYETPYNVNYGDLDARKRLRVERGGGGSESLLTPVVGGRHVVPAGVAVEELGDVTKLSDTCPEQVQELLQRKGMLSVYERFIHTLVKSKSTRSWASGWRSREIQAVLEDFQAEFEAGGLHVVLCKLTPDTGESFRWFEFIDSSVATNYVPQYNVANISEEVELETSKMTLHFPNGVAVEMLQDQKRLVENVPPAVKRMMEKKGCMDLYVALVDILGKAGFDDSSGWSRHNMKQITSVIGPKFEAKGVSIFLSAMKKEEDDATKADNMYWMEFVDRDLQPNYLAQRGVNMKNIPPGAMSKKELAEIAISTTLTVGINAAFLIMEFT